MPTALANPFVSAAREGFLDRFGYMPTSTAVEESGRRLLTLSDLYIRDKSQRLINLGESLNETQTTYLDQLSRDYATYEDPLTGDTKQGFDWRNGRFTIRGLREDILKFRQPGFSTLINGIFFLDTVNNPYTQTVVMAHDPHTTELMLAMMWRYYDNLDPEIKPRLKYGTKDGYMQFRDLDSGIYVGRVGSKGFGRGSTANNVLMSERAFWPAGGDEVEGGLLQSVPHLGNIVRETTANGYNEFYEQYKAAERRSAAAKRSLLPGEYRPRFFGWNIHREYRLKPPADFAVTPEEAQLARDYKLDDWQLVWRRVKKAELERLRRSFEQEYPLNSVEAFKSGGEKAVFNRDYLHKRIDWLMRTDEDGNLQHVPVTTYDEGEYDIGGTCRIWKDAVPGRSYGLMVDPSEGLNSDNVHDSTSMDVFCLETWEQVAHYSGKPDPGTCGRDAVWLAQCYNDALVMVERNNHGHAVLMSIRDIYGYANLYEHEEYDSWGQQQWRPGFPATWKSKMEGDGLLAGAVQDLANGLDGLVINDTETLEQMITYVKLAGGKHGGEGTAHDDCVTTARMGHYWLMKGAPGPEGHEGRYTPEPREPDLRVGATTKMRPSPGRDGRDTRGSNRRGAYAR